MTSKSTLILLAITLFLGGCSMTTISNSIKGQHYLATGNYTQGVETFTRAVNEDPENGSGHYYLGRFLLAQHKFDQALPHLRKAVQLDNNDDYYFWQGVAYGHLGDNRKEKDSYVKALQLNRNNPQALLYLGHIKLKEANYSEALHLYDAVLKYYPTNPSALYNRALTLRFLNRKAEEKKAWQKYLDWYPAGYLAGRAADHLNSLEDFSFRNHFIGGRTITLKEITFTSTNSSQLSSTSLPSLKVIGTTLVNLPEEVLQVVVYHESSSSVARERANAIKEYLLDHFPEIENDRIRLSWFKGRERLELGNRVFRVKNSVRLFSTS